ncbi:MAG: UbiA family prenyltransferase, partial [Acholeplasma sp.]|nr:UbiA family prenyltransferase [Acholeplasma sp.]
IDRKVGKTNFAKRFSKSTRVLMIIIVVVGSIIPWIYLDHRLGFIVFILQMILLIVYSSPPIRLKNFSVLSVITDAFYSSLLPSIIAVLLFVPISMNLIHYNYGLSLLLIVMFFRGLRNILIHHIKDIENDKNSNSGNFAVKYGSNTTIKLLKVITLIESFVYIIFLIYFTYFCNIWFVVLIPISLLYFVSKRFDSANKSNLVTDHMQILNDLYEDIFPLFILILLAFFDNYFIILLIIHLILFRNKMLIFLLHLIFIRIAYGIIYRKSCGLINRICKTNF